jgi:hypothetical protein
MDKTRTEDLGRLEAARDRGNVRAAQILERTYASAKNYDLTRMRRELVKAHRNNDHQGVAKMENYLKQYQ